MMGSFTASPTSGPRRALQAYGARSRLFNAVLALGLAWSAAAAAAQKLVLAFGDSLTTGYGLPAAEGFTAQLERALRARGLDVAVRNAGVSGDTSAGGRSRLLWALGEAKPDLVLLELGANDALRGLDPEELRKNLDFMVGELKRRDIPVLLAGMQAPRNLDAAYRDAFAAAFAEVADKHGVPLYPFFLDGVAMDPRLNQPDGIHPNAQGVSVIVERIAPHVIRALESRG
jgi:acyl-CoA thioesterase I